MRSRRRSRAGRWLSLRSLGCRTASRTFRPALHPSRARCAGTLAGHAALSWTGTTSFRSVASSLAWSGNRPYAPRPLVCACAPCVHVHVYVHVCLFVMCLVFIGSPPTVLWASKRRAGSGDDKSLSRPFCHQAVWDAQDSGGLAELGHQVQLARQDEQGTGHCEERVEVRAAAAGQRRRRGQELSVATIHFSCLSFKPSLNPCKKFDPATVLSRRIMSEHVSILSIFRTC